MMSLQREGTNVSLVVIRIGKTYQELNAVVRGQRCRYAVLVRKHFFCCNGIALRAIICLK